mgnify:CR=1 FL=1
MITGKAQAPKWPRRLLVWYCGKSLAEDLVGDVEELFNLNLSRMSVQQAMFKDCLQSLSLLFSHTVAVRKRNKVNLLKGFDIVIKLFNDFDKLLPKVAKPPPIREPIPEAPPKL